VYSDFIVPVFDVFGRSVKMFVRVTEYNTHIVIVLFYQYCLYCVDIKHHLTNISKLPLSSLSKTSPKFLKYISKLKSWSRLCNNGININIIEQHFTNISENLGTNSDTEILNCLRLERLHIRELDTLFSGEVIFLTFQIEKD
jgi:hypothetical protein